MKRVIIVGAGIIGLMCAVRLAKAGARVTVLDSEPDNLSVFSPTASAAAAGMLAPFDGACSGHDALALDSFDLWRAWREGAVWADGVRFEGAVVLRNTESEIEALRARVLSVGRAATPLTGAQVYRRTGLEPAPGHALLLEDEGAADPLRVLSALALEARTHGVILRRDCDVLDAGPAWVRTHENSTLEADSIVLAPGAWANDALAAAAPALKHVSPGKGHLVSVELGRALHPNLHAPAFYLAERREDVVLGATMEMGLYNRNVDPAKVESLLAAAAAVFPGQVRPRGHAWTGVRPMSPDGWPLIGRDGQGLLLAAGHSRNGWLLAPVTAEIISAYVFGAEIAPPWASLSPQRFEA